MQPWAHESELAVYLTSQRVAWKSRRPILSSPPGTQSHISHEDISHLDRAIVALQELRGEFPAGDTLSGQIGQLLDFALSVRNSLPLQVPEEAFERLRPLRSWLFWLPPLMLQSNETELGVMAVLSHFFSIAMTMEPLFPEIGAAYVGSMSISPVEEMHQILMRRRIERPQDSNVMAALGLMDFPYQVMTSYKGRIEHMNRNAEIYRSAPHSPYGIQDLQLAYSSDMPPPMGYQRSPLGSPAHLSIPTAPGSPFLDPRTSTSASQRSSQYLGQPSPILHSQVSVSEGMLPSQHGIPAGPYSAAPFGPEGDLNFGDAPFHGYQESYHAYGGMGGCVAPAELIRT